MYNDISNDLDNEVTYMYIYFLITFKGEVQ